MIKVKLCGLRRSEDIIAANQLMPDYVGFVFAPKSKRLITKQQAEAFRALLNPLIVAVGVFTDEKPENVAELLNQGVIQMAQLHGHEDDSYISVLRTMTDKPILQAFQIHGEEDVCRMLASKADCILADSGAGSGMTMNWQLLKDIQRPYFLAGGLTPENVSEAISYLNPFALDVSSGIETDGWKNKEKMADFVGRIKNR